MINMYDEIKQYLIPEENYESLIKKINRIKNKAEKFGCEVIFKELESVFIKDENDNIRKFYKVYACGTAKVDGWEFIGTIEHTPNGNILRGMNPDKAIPERYRCSKPYCEHCNTNRLRKDTYVIFNEESKEYKQVGKSCLKDFTNGLSASHIAVIESFEKEIKDSTEYFGGEGTKTYLDIKELLKHYLKSIKIFGFSKSDNGYDSTRSLGRMMYDSERDRLDRFEKKFLEDKLDGIDIKAFEVSDEEVEDALEWAKGLETDSSYLGNIKVIANLTYVEYKHLGLLAALGYSYLKEVERRERVEAAKKQFNNLKHLGNVGEKVTINVADFRVITSWETMYGTTFVYKFVDTNANVVTWKTSKHISTCSKLTGTIKALNFYNDIAQTELTRCKVIENKGRNPLLVVYKIIFICYN
nr:MAG TPA: hypothetical protein [Caudoviricetes sp.]